MALALKLLHISLSLRRLIHLLKPLRGWLPQALRWILGRLAFIWPILRSKLGFQKQGISIGNSLTSAQDGEPKDGTRSYDSCDSCDPERAEIALLEPKSTLFTLVEQEKIISLDHVALSAYPFPPITITGANSFTDGPPNSNRSTHNLTTRVDNASRSWPDLVSEHSHRRGLEHSNSLNSMYDRTTAAYLLHQPTLDLPVWQETTPHHQHTMPTPNLEVISPIEDMPRGGDVQVEILHVPTRSVTPVAFVQLGDPRILPQMPEDFATRRYGDRPRKRKRFTSMTIGALQKDFIKPVPPSGWVRYVHPDGARYFYNDTEKVYTHADLFDPEIFRQIHEDIITIKNCLNNNNVHLSDTNVLVLDVFYAKAEGEQRPIGQPKVIQTIYHLADHEQRVVFFLDNFEACDLYGWYQLSNVTSETHLRCEIEAQYWSFIQMFPHALALTSPMVAELRDITVFYVGEHITSPYSNAPYTSESSHNILTLVSVIENNILKDNVVNVGSVDVLARLMYLYCHARFQNFHGEPNARLERNFSVHGDPVHPRTLLIKIFSIFLFLAPHIHLKTLQNMWVDGLIHKFQWQMSMKQLSEGWEGFVLVATVMLNANLAFLAIQSVDVDANPYRSPAQISSYLSVTANLGSIVLGLLLMRHNRMESQMMEMRAFLASRNHPLLGLETLAILYSLPYALLIWGIVSFLAAFFFMCFQDSSTATRILVGSLSAAVAILIGWCVSTTWIHPSEEPPIPTFLDEEENLVVDDSDQRSSLSSERHETRPSLLDRLMSLPSVLKAGGELYDADRTAV